MPEPANPQEQKRRDTLLGAVLGVVLIPVVFAGGLFAIPYSIFLRWRRKRHEIRLRALMKAQHRWIGWQEFLRAMNSRGGTCIEERFSPKGPVRFWWTPENVYTESPHEIIDWFTMRKGRRGADFVHWCRARYTSPDSGSAVLVETWMISQKEIYGLWAKCHSQTGKARWVEVAPPEILPHRAGQ